MKKRQGFTETKERLPIIGKRIIGIREDGTMGPGFYLGRITFDMDWPDDKEGKPELWKYSPEVKE